MTFALLFRLDFKRKRIDEDFFGSYSFFFCLEEWIKVLERKIHDYGITSEYSKGSGRVGK